ncbi:MAG: hypothetical protein ACREYE_25755, partial [Gammaproteobacteria bacterium]
DIIKKIERARVKMEQIKPRSTLPRGKKEGGLTVKLFKEHYTRIGQGSKALEDLHGYRSIEIDLAARVHHTHCAVPDHPLDLDIGDTRVGGKSRVYLSFGHQI